jgi:hypothetical protein
VEKEGGIFGLSAISYQLSAISYQLSAISYQLSAISYQHFRIQISKFSKQSPAQIIGLIFLSSFKYHLPVL